MEGESQSSLILPTSLESLRVFDCDSLYSLNLTALTQLKSLEIILRSTLSFSPDYFDTNPFLKIFSKISLEANNEKLLGLNLAALTSLQLLKVSCHFNEELRDQLQKKLPGFEISYGNESFVLQASKKHPGSKG